MYIKTNSGSNHFWIKFSCSYTLALFLISPIINSKRNLMISKSYIRPYNRYKPLSLKMRFPSFQKLKWILTVLCYLFYFISIKFYFAYTFIIVIKEREWELRVHCFLSWQNSEDEPVLCWVFGGLRCHLVFQDYWSPVPWQDSCLFSWKML